VRHTELGVAAYLSIRPQKIRPKLQQGNASLDFYPALTNLGSLFHVTLQAVGSLYSRGGFTVPTWMPRLSPAFRLNLGWLWRMPASDVNLCHDSLQLDFRAAC